MNRELLEEKLKNREQLILQQNEKISALEKEIEKLKYGCQHDDPSWCDPNTCMVPRRKLDQRDKKIKVLEQENAAFRDGLEKIRDQDYRGNRSTESNIAFHVLAKYPKKENRSVMGG